MSEIDAVNIFVEFLEIAIHVILHTRKIYPDGIFERRRKYGIPVNVSIHPQLNSYITECSRAIQYLAERNALKKCYVCFISPHHTVIQRYVFDILKLNNCLNEDPYLIKCEQMLRAFCLRIAASESYLPRLPQGSTFEIHVNSTESASIDLAQDVNFQQFPWIETDCSTVNEGTNSSIIPIQTIDTDFLLLQSYVEQY